MQPVAFAKFEHLYTRIIIRVNASLIRQLAAKSENMDYLTKM